VFELSGGLYSTEQNTGLIFMSSLV